MKATSDPFRVTLQVAVETSDELPGESEFARWVNTALSEVPGVDLPEQACVTIRIVTSTESSKLNSSFRDTHHPTNVLAFPAGINALPEEADCEAELGDLVICYDVVSREAEQQNKNFCAHMAHMTVHGVLHLAGLDHYEEAEANMMEPLEIQVLETLGFENPYADVGLDTSGA
ncbi:MAG: rRNA maturation RNase YbeY [Gammaproteobacteria bacterium]|nr:rRNA maturation RNase YbeY [Gammaproteobacteria bacterium]MCP4276812.1 rRNA maturation RNase YbeY [Gammaproteobacteria bacterium]MCP4830655.1 rRNA maturation RNase YbeY [Gammaproteobacteria bacterium]MCP4928464.1 rRNA maturation RNase YbeY [Gammaproteobacteria bacterium]